MEPRKEIKYRIGPYVREQVILDLFQIKAGFVEEFPDRYVQSIYFDSPNYSAYHANIDGVSSRRKWRLRWYGVEGIYDAIPVLECKVKENAVGWKIREEVPRDTNTSNQLLSWFYQHHLHTTNQFPTVHVQYLRSYYTSISGHVRLTIDRMLRYASMHDFIVLPEIYHDQSTILELKYSLEHEAEAQEIMSKLPYRITKNSKYVSAVEALFHLRP